MFRKKCTYALKRCNQYIYEYKSPQLWLSLNFPRPQSMTERGNLSLKLKYILRFLSVAILKKDATISTPYCFRKLWIVEITHKRIIYLRYIHNSYCQTLICNLNWAFFISFVVDVKETIMCSSAELNWVLTQG